MCKLSIPELLYICLQKRYLLGPFPDQEVFLKLSCLFRPLFCSGPVQTGLVQSSPVLSSLVWSWSLLSFFLYFEPGSCYVAQGSLEITKQTKLTFKSYRSTCFLSAGIKSVCQTNYSLIFTTFYFYGYGYLTCVCLCTMCACGDQKGIVPPIGGSMTSSSWKKPFVFTVLNELA